MDIALRLAGRADAEPLAGLMAAYYRHDRLDFDPGRAGAAAQALMDDPRLGELWAIETGGQMIGYLALTFGFSLECGGRDAFVDELFVREEFRGQGVGTRAIRHALARCAAQGIRSLRIEAARHNPRAVALYRRLGFAEHERHLMTLAL